MKFTIMITCLAGLMLSCQAQAPDKAEVIEGSLVPAEYENGQLIKVEKTNEEWAAELNKKEYHILREAGTERAFTGDLWNHKEEGTYVCAACGLPLFASQTKFKSEIGRASCRERV